MGSDVTIRDMAGRDPKSPRSGATFSVRTMIVLVTIVCACFAYWIATWQYGVPAVEQLPNQTRAEVAFPGIICSEEWKEHYHEGRPRDFTKSRCYYFWLGRLWPDPGAGPILLSFRR